MTTNRPGRLQLRLYVAGKTAQSSRAMENMDRLLKGPLSGICEIEVVDVTERPDRAERDKILATPTLLKSLPEPARKIIGDLSDAERVLTSLDLPWAANL